MKACRVVTYALFATTSVFGQESLCKKEECWRPGDPLKASCTASYNAPATFDVNPNCGVDFFADLSFTYWLAQEEGLTLAYIAAAGDDFSPGGPNTSVSELRFQESSFKPGFKVGFGMVADHEWVLQAEYTWYRSTNTTLGAPLTESVVSNGEEGTEVWLIYPWYLQGGAYGTSFSSTWDLGLDLIDATISRPFYQGRNATLEPFAGLRAAWIRQSLNIATEESPLSRTDALPPQPVYSKNNTHCWAVGPRIGVGSQLLLPVGLQLEAACGVSLLYTNYTLIKHTEGTLDILVQPKTSYTMNRFGCLRPAAELSLGAGWGTYFSDGNYHLNFSADYDMMIFWSQNMIRVLLDNYWVNGNSSPANLYLQGLTLTGRFDF